MPEPPRATLHARAAAPAAAGLRAQAQSSSSDSASQPAVSGRCRVSASREVSSCAKIQAPAPFSPDSRAEAGSVPSKVWRAAKKCRRRRAVREIDPRARVVHAPHAPRLDDAAAGPEGDPVHVLLVVPAVRPLGFLKPQPEALRPHIRQPRHGRRGAVDRGDLREDHRRAGEGVREGRARRLVIGRHVAGLHHRAVLQDVAPALHRHPGHRLGPVPPVQMVPLVHLELEALRGDVAHAQGRRIAVVERQRSHNHRGVVQRLGEADRMPFARIRLRHGQRAGLAHQLPRRSGGDGRSGRSGGLVRRQGHPLEGVDPAQEGHAQRLRPRLQRQVPDRGRREARARRDLHLGRGVGGRLPLAEGLHAHRARLPRQRQRQVPGPRLRRLDRVFQPLARARVHHRAARDLHVALAPAVARARLQARNVEVGRPAQPVVVIRRRKRQRPVQRGRLAPVRRLPGGVRVGHAHGLEELGEERVVPPDRLQLRQLRVRERGRLHVRMVQDRVAPAAPGAVHLDDRGGVVLQLHMGRAVDPDPRRLAVRPGRVGRAHQHVARHVHPVGGMHPDGVPVAVVDQVVADHDVLVGQATLVVQEDALRVEGRVGQQQVMLHHQVAGGLVGAGGPQLDEVGMRDAGLHAQPAAHLVVGDAPAVDLGHAQPVGLHGVEDVALHRQPLDLHGVEAEGEILDRVALKDEVLRLHHQGRRAAVAGAVHPSPLGPAAELAVGDLHVLDPAAHLHDAVGGALLVAEHQVPELQVVGALEHELLEHCRVPGIGRTEDDRVRERLVLVVVGRVGEQLVGLLPHSSAGWSRLPWRRSRLGEARRSWRR